MSDLRKAAEAVLERWDSPAWEWMKQGPTAELMATLRAALAAPRPEPVAYFDLQKQVFFWAKPTMIDVPMTVALNPLPLYTTPPTAAPREDIETLRRDAERLRRLLTDASKAVWMNYDGDLLDRIEAALKEVPR